MSCAKIKGKMYKSIIMRINDKKKMKLHLGDFQKNEDFVLWYTETVFSRYIQSLVPKCAYFISLSNGNTFRSYMPNKYNKS
jgi:translation initiation factor IF-1